MAVQFPELSDELSQFIGEQKIFFVATAAQDGRINLSPKGQDSLRVLNSREILWMNLTGSGNETAAHLAEFNRITMMWCAFEGPPRILRVYGTAQVFHPRDARWAEFSTQLPSTTGTRQYFLVSIELVQTSCGYAVPFMNFVEDRRVLSTWAEKKGEEGISDYWQKKNQLSIDGKPTGIFGSERD
ncbi:MAG TPA: pyridoxamine 5'-phosphate oxidase family protein [Nitrospiraceae bacterium]|nr:pyridoxamine 5'-phosphate oxidase family protein [Nitrospiraceae bacterium]